MADPLRQFGVAAAAKRLTQGAHYILIVAVEIRVLPDEVTELIQIAQGFAKDLIGTGCEAASVISSVETAVRADRTGTAHRAFARASLELAIAWSERSALTGLAALLALTTLLALARLTLLALLTGLLTLPGLSLLALLTGLALLALLPGC